MADLSKCLERETGEQVKGRREGESELREGRTRPPGMRQTVSEKEGMSLTGGVKVERRNGQLPVITK